MIWFLGKVGAQFSGAPRREQGWMLSGTGMPEKCRPHSVRLPGIIFRTVKTLLSVIALTGFISSAFAAKDGWLDDIEKAKEQAKQGGKRILLDFTGSDWCGWCKKLDAEVFSQQEFKDYAAKRLVFVEVDFPKGFKLPDATQKQNDALAKRPNVQGYPTIIVTSPSGQKCGPAWLHGGRPEGVHQGPRKGKVRHVRPRVLPAASQGKNYAACP